MTAKPNDLMTAKLNDLMTAKPNDLMTAKLNDLMTAKLNDIKQCLQLAALRMYDCLYDQFTKINFYHTRSVLRTTIHFIQTYFLDFRI